LTVHDKTTSNFSSPENFVVFECVHKLLSQGYHPQHIELEKKGKAYDNPFDFQDRLQQLLKKDAVIGIIVPRSILNKDTLGALP